MRPEISELLASINLRTAQPPLMHSVSGPSDEDGEDEGARPLDAGREIVELRARVAVLERAVAKIFDDGGAS